jgi:hypothetical protein
MYSTWGIRSTWLRAFARGSEVAHAAGDADAAAAARWALQHLRAGSMRDYILRSSVARFVGTNVAARGAETEVYHYKASYGEVGSFCVSPSGNVMIVFDSGCYCERVFALQQDAAGRWRRMVHSNGGRVTRKRGICAHAVAVDDAGTVYIADTCKQRLFVLRRAPKFVVHTVLRQEGIGVMCTGGDDALAVCSYSADRRSCRLLTYRYEDEALVRSRRVTLAGLTSCAALCWAARDGSRVAVTSCSGCVNVHDAASGELLRQLRSGLTRPSLLAFASDGVLVVGDCVQLLLWTVDDDDDVQVVVSRLPIWTHTTYTGAAVHGATLLVSKRCSETVTIERLG